MATEEFYSLKAKARLAGITRSEYIRRCIAASIVRQRLSSELMSHLRQLSGMANNPRLRNRNFLVQIYGVIP